MSVLAPLRRSTSVLPPVSDRSRHPGRRDMLSVSPPLTLPPARTLSETLLHWARTEPARPLLHFIDLTDRLTTLTAADLLLNARRLAAGLREHGVRPRDPVILSFGTSPEFLETFFACALLGATPCLVDLPSSKVPPEAWGRGLRAKLRLLNASALVIDVSFAAQAREALAGTRSGHRDDAVQVLGVEELLDAGQLPEDEVWSCADDTAFVQFTSGTTGSPKGVRVSQQALMANIGAMGERVRWTADDLMVGWLPLFHDMGLVATTLAAFVHGMPTVLMPPMAFLLQPVRWLWAIHHFRGTASFAPNFAYQFSARRIKDVELAGLDLSSWRCAFNAAEFIHAETLRLFGERFEPYGFDPLAFLPAYGMAEMTVGVSIRDPDEPLVVEFVSRTRLAVRREAVVVPEDSAEAVPVVGVGAVLAGHEVRIVDESGCDVGERREGQVVVRGPSMFQGYFADPEATSRVLRDGWIWTGDLGYLADGQLFICGRDSDLIIKAGENYHPYLMENAAAKVTGVRQGCVAAVGVPDPEAGTEDIVIVFETTETDEATLLRMRRLVREQVFLDCGVRPNRVVPWPPRTLPKTTSGKVRRKEIAAALSRTRSAATQPEEAHI
ncbi:AMP-binding protein [Microbispora sp. NEAU-D428]|uniref:AMP-binding protein n=1 Tax=Microbispora sitophila TaxID=2771537 RepID=UPI001869126C|nr:AMP-binding protein [Microbispora sitophila]MBE3012125.1 AMP-binding protein [Microbispora sitophila]